METKAGFWKRQFVGQPTQRQVVFDIVFGIAGPALCFVFDPIVFRSDNMGPPLFADFQAFAYFFSGFEILVLALWMALGARLQFLTPLVGGILLGGSVFCAIVGCLLLPFTLVGLLLFVGIFGFTPFLTALVYSRNGYRALKTDSLAGRSSQVAYFLLGLVLAFAGPGVVATGLNQVVNIAVYEIVHGSEQEASIAAHRVRPLSFLGLGNFDRIVAEIRQHSRHLTERAFEEIL